MLKYVRDELENTPAEATHYIAYDETKEVGFIKLKPNAKTQFYSKALEQWIEAEPWSITNNLHRAIEIKT